MQSFARHTKLPNICGRVNYILNEKKQEEIVCHGGFYDFTEYADFEKANQKSAVKNNEGREVIISIPNEWYQLPREELKERCQHLAEVACDKKTDMTWALHWNKARTNLHIHVVFSERTKLLEKEIKRYDRDVYLTNEGKVARKKADRAVDQRTGEVLPPVHRKGEIKGMPFSAKNKAYKTREWFEGTKTRLQGELERMGAKIDERGILHEWHEGKGQHAHLTKEKNELIREVNQRAKEFKMLLTEREQILMKETIKNKIKEQSIVVPHVSMVNERPKWQLVVFKSYNKAKSFIEKTRKQFNEIVFKQKTLRINALAREYYEINQRLISAHLQLDGIKEAVAPSKDLLRRADRIEEVHDLHQENINKLHMLERQHANIKGLFKGKERAQIENQINAVKEEIQTNINELQRLGVLDPLAALKVAKQYRHRYELDKYEYEFTIEPKNNLEKNIAIYETKIQEIVKAIPKNQREYFELKVKEIEQEEIIKSMTPGADSREQEHVHEKEKERVIEREPKQKTMSMDDVKRELSRRRERNQEEKPREKKRSSERER